LLSGRVDYSFSDNDKIFGRVKFDRGLQPTYTDSVNPAFNDSSNQPQDEGQLNYTHLFSPNVVNNFIGSVLYYAAIFGNPDLVARLGATRLAGLRRLAEAENAWIIGRELVRQGRRAEGQRWLTRSVAAAPSLRRVGLLAAAHALPLLPQAWRGPFRAYAVAGASPA